MPSGSSLKRLVADGYDNMGDVYLDRLRGKRRPEITDYVDQATEGLPDGSRVHAIIPPGCRNGTCLTIRKFSPGGLSLDDLIGFGSLSESAREFLEICVRLHKNIIISGGTGTGKTSLLGAVSAAVPCWMMSPTWRTRSILCASRLSMTHCTISLR